ncbi:hypothetical protein F1C76_06900 [Geodermatophilaceae bacterium NBWT11]|nr:hypothetical protein F1C76_06900 [Geodermatophilaceae bacterium NBWT11]
MRLTTTVTSGLSAAAALVLLTACGGADSDATASSSAGSSAAGSSGPAESSAATDDESVAFCTEAEAVLTEVGPQLESATPETIPSVLQQVVDGFDTLTPPAAIEGDFGTLRDAYATLLESANANDLTTPEGESAFQAVFSDVHVGGHHRRDRGG